MNENNNTPKISEQDLNNLATELQKEAPNKNLLKEIAQSTNLSPEEIKQTFPHLEKEWENDRVEPIKTATDEQKVKDYDRLKVKDLPADWKLQLARLKHLESELANYTKTKQDLKGWTDTFGEEIKPQEVERKIEEGEAENERREKELEEKIKELETNLEAVNQERSQFVEQKTQIIKELETELKEWKEFFGNRGLSEVKTEWQILHQRPDIPLTENEFYDDYARRKSIKQNELESQELSNLKSQLAEKEKQIQSFQQKLDTILENTTQRGYVLADPVITQDQAREAIEELLAKKEKQWEEYLKTGQGAEELDITLTFYPHKRNLAEQVLEWIRQARNTHDYQQLFENWSGSTYDKEKDLDGSLLLLGNWLEKFNQSGSEQ